MTKSKKGQRPAKPVIIAPAKLHPDAVKFAAGIDAEYELDTLARGYLDQAEHHLSLSLFAREMIDREGMVVKTKTGYPMMHPAYRVLKESSGLFARFMSLMGIDIEPPGPIGRPTR